MIDLYVLIQGENINENVTIISIRRAVRLAIIPLFCHPPVILFQILFIRRETSLLITGRLLATPREIDFHRFRNNNRRS